VQSVAKTHVALLRGINVGGKNKLPMTNLARMFVEEGCHDVRTFIQSGNVIFRAESEVVALLSDRIVEQIAKRYKYQTSLILRTAADLDSIVRHNPFLKRGVPQDDLHVLFLADIPEPSAAGLLDRNRSAPDEFEVRGREIYLSLPNGAAKTKLTNAYFDSRLATTSTGRNWRTTTKLLALARA
jgi:uncharacterized protein (DUF1697 family)